MRQLGQYEYGVDLHDIEKLFSLYKCDNDILVMFLKWFICLVIHTDIFTNKII